MKARGVGGGRSSVDSKFGGGNIALQNCITQLSHVFKIYQRVTLIQPQRERERKREREGGGGGVGKNFLVIFMQNGAILSNTNG